VDHVAALDVAAGRGQDEQDRVETFRGQGQQAFGNALGLLEVDPAGQKDRARLEQRRLKEGVRLGRRAFFLVLIIEAEVGHAGSGQGNRLWPV